MTSVAASPETAPAPSSVSVAVRACAIGVLTSAALMGVVGITGAVPVELRGHVWQGFGLAVATGVVGTAVQTWLSMAPADRDDVAQRYVLGMVGNFLLQVGAVVLGCVSLAAGATKFPAIAAFGLAFAAAATTLHVAGVVVVSRALLVRSATATHPSETVSRETGSRTDRKAR